MLLTKNSDCITNNAFSHLNEIAWFSAPLLPIIMMQSLYFFLILIPFPTDSSALAQESCVTSECHVEVGKAKYSHGPIAVKECAVCHVVGKNDLPPKKHDLSFLILIEEFYNYRFHH